MTSTDKIVAAVKATWGFNTQWCQYVTALHIVATREAPQSEARDALIAHLETMHEQVKDLCHSHDKLRSLTGALEIEQGISSPTFYVGERADKACKMGCPHLGNGKKS